MKRSKSSIEYVESESFITENEGVQGVPGRKSRLPVQDVVFLVAQFICLAAATISIFWPPAAIMLGQVNQLIAIGFLLAVMGLIFDNLAKQAALVFAASSRRSTVQDFDAFMRKDLTASQVHWQVRVVLLMLVSLPLGLAAAYKTFTGGNTTRLIVAGEGAFGFTAPPGKQRIGDGLSLLSDLYIPFWIDPAMNRTYGYALYIRDNETAVIVDCPLPDGQQTIRLRAKVNATVSRMINPTDEERASEDYWMNLSNQYGLAREAIGGIDGATSSLWAGTDSSGVATNYSVIFLAQWNSTKNETFESEAIRTVVTREEANAEWVISTTNLTLTNVELLPNTQLADQDIIQRNTLSVQSIFSAFLGEYDWHNRAGAFSQPYPAGTVEKPLWYQPVNTVPSLAAAMVWARISSLDEPSRPHVSWKNITGYSKAVNDIRTVQTYPTLKRSPLLMTLLLVLPVLSIACLALKAIYSDVPVGNNFNSIAMLAAADLSTLKILRGAGLTGTLRRKIPVAFTVCKDIRDSRKKVGKVVMTLGSRSSQQDTVESDMLYY
ncbi:uncharacterized protein PV09_04395 [Verruconis gallopava]|uniref:Uncharacterized protein n=1 Tax=Verruconis gallopava TaxID=253628 RepID=A0A0D2ADW2_9PEZI|nr:uncharacterized protein PV09_04395 [Verruconis gallopava]KIW04650.1 hypothetical protein PV09_04395 [Verruconis gallopava]